jgi:hypothetical protein
MKPNRIFCQIANVIHHFCRGKVAQNLAFFFNFQKKKNCQRKVGSTNYRPTQSKLCINFNKKGLATFWAIFPQTHLVTLFTDPLKCVEYIGTILVNFHGTIHFCPGAKPTNPEFTTTAPGL